MHICNLDSRHCAARTEEEEIPLPSNKTATIDKSQIKVITSKYGTLACLSGRVDMDSSPAIRDQLLLVMQAADHKIVSIDLSAVTHFDSSGIATLIDALRVARNSKTHLSLRGLHGRLLHLFEVTGILGLFNRSTEISQPGYKAI
jgi:anti-sigma B factor antagonist